MRYTLARIPGTNSAIAGAADERAERDAEAAHAGPDTERHPRFSPASASESSVSGNGRTMAAPRPCSARAAIRLSIVGASAARALAPVKTPGR